MQVDVGRRVRTDVVLDPASLYVLFPADALPMRLSCGRASSSRASWSIHRGLATDAPRNLASVRSRDALTLATNKPMPRTTKAIDVRLDDERPLSLVLLADADGEPRLFENFCPHAGGPLNLFPDAFLAPDKTELLCTRHGARFKLDDGLCTAGPCAGRALNALAVHVCDESGRVSVTLDEVRRVCREGGAAGLERQRRELRLARARSQR